jgi:hypothetical protein
MGGCFCKMSVTVKTVFWTPSGYSNLQGFICKVAIARARERAWACPCSLYSWAAWAEIGPGLFIIFPFLFLARLQQF